MNKFWIILGHTYMTRFKTKSFLISTIIPILFIIGAFNFQSIMDTFTSGDQDEIAVIDQTDNNLSEGLQEAVKKADEDIKLVNYDGSIEEAKKAVEDEQYAGLVILSLDNEKLPEGVYYADNITESGNQITIQEQLQQLKVAIATKQAGINQDKLEQIYAPVKFDTEALDKNAKSDEELSQTRGIVYVMLFVLYITVLVYGQMIAMDVATEKTSRVMEILISSVSPVIQMFAKIFGIALLGLTQIALLVATGYIMLTMKQDAISDGGIFTYFGIQGASLSLFIYAIVFFVLGYLLYATLAAMLGSLVSRIEDVQQLMMPMMFLIIAAFMIAMFGLTSPETGFVTITSFIPFFSPMLMFLRVGMLDVPVWEIALSLGLLIGTILLFAIIGARVYKGGVLMYGKSSSLKDFKKALALSKKEK